MTEMGNTNNLSKRKGVFKRLRNNFFPTDDYNSNRSMRNWKRQKQYAEPQKLNSGKGKNTRSYNKESALVRLVGDGYTIDVNTVVGSIGVALYDLYLLERGSTGLFTDKKKYAKEMEEDFAESRAIAEKKIFDYINKYMPFKGTSLSSNIQTLLQRTLDEYSRLPETGINGSVVYMIKKNKFWGNILPIDDEELESLRKKYQEASGTNTFLGYDYKEEVNPAFQNMPNASTLPSPNFTTSNLNGKTRRNRKSRKQNRKTRRN